MMCFRRDDARLSRLKGNARLADLAGFPTDFLSGWTLDKLRDRVVMVAQFDVGRFTFEEALFEAFGRINDPPWLWDLWDDEMRRHVVECNRKATAAQAAILEHLKHRKVAT